MDAKPERIQKMAGLLDTALHQRQVIEPVVELDPGLDVDDAYAVQMINVARELERGAAVSGKKIGRASCRERV